MATVKFETTADFSKLLSTHPEVEKRVHKITKSVILTAQSNARRQLGGYIPSTRETYMGVRAMVYKRILGGQINIFRRKRRAGQVAPVPPQVFKLETATNSAGNHRGGNRMKRSADTERMMSYAGPDRWMVLGWLNSGTAQRTSRCGNRGSIAGLNFFTSIGERAIEMALSKMDELCDELVKEFNK